MNYKAFDEAIAAAAKAILKEAKEAETDPNEFTNEIMGTCLKYAAISLVTHAVLSGVDPVKVKDAFVIACIQVFDHYAKAATLKVDSGTKDSSMA